MLLSLNDDCLLYICELLSYYDQSILAHTCQRLQLIVEENCWHKRKIVLVNKEQCSYFAQKPDYFIKFMKCISTNVEHLQLACTERKIFNALKEFRFPKVTQLKIDFNYMENKDRNDDEYTELISTMFPYLTKLSPPSDISGKYLWNLTNLTELDVSGCESLHTKHFKKIFSTLQLKKLNIMFYSYNTCFDELVTDICECSTLEELYIDDHHLSSLIDQLPKLRKLHKLVTFTRDCSSYVLGKIVKQSGDNINSMIFDDVFCLDDDHCEIVRKMNNLQRLIFNDDFIKAHQLELIGQKLGNTLKEFRFINGSYFSKIEDSLIELLNHCKNLEIFDISSSECNINFLRKVIESISRNLKNRSNPITIRCFDTNITEEDAEILTIPNVIEIKLTEEKIKFPGTRCFEIEWI